MVRSQSGMGKEIQKKRRRLWEVNKVHGHTDQFKEKKRGFRLRPGVNGPAKLRSPGVRIKEIMVFPFRYLVEVEFHLGQGQGVWSRGGGNRL